jgi:plasmid maintenance system antidote protein VapI
MAVKDQDELIRQLETARQALDRARASVLQEVAESPGITVHELSERFHVPEDSVLAFVQTAGELMGDRPLDAETARRAALVAVAGQVWENELEPLLSSSQVGELLGGVSRQRVDELLRSRRLIGLRDSGGRRRFPAFQFVDGQPLQPLISAFWTVADAAVSDWTAASWCVAPDDALEGLTPVEWARSHEDGERLQRIAHQDAARLGQ